METKLGKIENVYFGYGGYQDAQFGISFTLSGKGWGVGDFKGFWSTNIEVTDRTKWTEAQRRTEFAKVMIYINELLNIANVKDINKLKNKPVEVTFDGQLLKSWRILEEVL